MMKDVQAVVGARASFTHVCNLALERADDAEALRQQQVLNDMPSCEVVEAKAERMPFSSPLPHSPLGEVVVEEVGGEVVVE